MSQPPLSAPVQSPAPTRAPPAEPGARSARATAAAPAPRRPAGAPAAGAQPAHQGQRITRSFHELGAPQQPLRLATWQASYTVKLPLSPREIIAGATLHLDTVNSTALIRSRSELSVRVNGRVIAQSALDPAQTRQRHDLALPMELLRFGYNDIEIGVVQNYTYDCQDPASPELWTEIDPLRSGITVDFRGWRPNTGPRLTQLPVAFDSRAWAPRRLSVVFGTDTLQEGPLAAATAAVQGLGLRRGHQPLAVDVFTAHAAQSLQRASGRLGGLASNIYRGRDVLLVGRRADLSRYVDSELHAVMSGAFVGVFSADEGHSVVLVVSGENDEQLMKAARAVADPEFKFSDAALAQVLAQVAHTRPVVAQPRQRVPLSAFGWRTATVRGAKVQPITFEFRAPADWGARRGDLLPLRLHFSYGAGLRRDSAMAVSLNGNFAVSIPLNEPTGAEFTNYEIRLPAQFVRPGLNQVTFTPVFIGQTQRCDMARDEHMVLTLFEDSTLELPAATQSPVVPDLARFGRSFWPFDQQLRVYLTNAEPASAAALLEFASASAQRNRAPLDVQLRFSPFESGHMLALGTHAGLSDFVARALPLQQFSWHAAGSHAALMQGVEGSRVVTAFLAPDAATLKDATHVLKTRGLWPALEGAAAVIDTQEGTLRTQPAAQVAVFGTRQQAAAYFHDWRWYAAAALAAAALFALSFMALLRQRARARQKTAAQEPGQESPPLA
jgi:hypothetical protein